MARTVRGPRLGGPRMRPIRFTAHVLFALLTLSIFSLRASAQSDPLNQVGYPTFMTSWPVQLGSTNISNGDLHQEIPFASFPQRGGRTLAAGLVYDSRIWQIVNNAWQPTNIPSSQGGWRFMSTSLPGTVSYASGMSGTFICNGHSVLKRAWADASTQIWGPPLRNYLAASPLRAVGVSRDMGGISASSKPATNMGVGATLPQRNSSQRARMNLVSGRRERSRIILVVPR